MSEKIMLIDGNSVINRAFYGVPLLSDSQGRYTNGVYGFLNILFKLMEEEKPNYLAVAFDLHAPTFRHKEFKQYKGTRKAMPEELREQMPLLKQVLDTMHIKMYEQEGFEADDILGSLSKKAETQGLEPIVVSGDRDLLQLASDILKVRIPKTKAGRTEVEDYYAADVVAKYGVTPLQFIELKALMGDASDNIPGVPGIGEKTASKIIQEFGDIEAAIAHADEIKPKKASENMKVFQEQARLSKYLATIVTDMPLQMELSQLGCEQMLNADAFSLFQSLGFKSFLGRFSYEKEQTAQINKAAQSIRFIENREALKDFIGLLKKEEEIAYIIYEEQKEIKAIGISSSFLQDTCITASPRLTQEEILQEVRTFFEDEAYFKIGNDVKKDIRLLRQFGITMSKVKFDTALGAYLLNPTNATYEYNDIAAEFLNVSYPSADEILGKGRNKKYFDDLDVSEKGLLIAQQSSVILQAQKVIAERLHANEQDELYYKIELPLLYVLADMEKQGIKVDRKALIAFGQSLDISIEEVTSAIYQMTGEQFNINSPKQLGVVLFEKMGLKGGKKTKTGYSTAAEVLEKLKQYHPVIEKIVEYRQLTKLKSTYVDGLLAVMEEGSDKIYSTFNQTITATGRISSTEPNLQNIPIRLELGRQLRKVFIPSSEEYCFLDGDYSQIELRVLAHIAEEETLTNAFIHGQDIHRLTASQVFNIAFEDVTPQQRSNAKAVNFGIVYGISAFSLSQDLNITQKEAKNYMEGYFAKYPSIKKYMDATIAQADKDGYVSTLYNRRRAMPELRSSNFNLRSFGERVAMNMPIQGSAADIIKIAMIRVYDTLKQRGLKSRLLLQVHDELLIEAHVSETEEVKQLLKDEMEHACELNAPLEVDVHMGNSWYEAK